MVRRERAALPLPLRAFDRDQPVAQSRR